MFKQTLLENGNAITYQVGKQLKNSTDYPNYSIDGLFQVSHGKGFRKDLLQVTVYNVGQWGVEIVFNFYTNKIERIKTQGRYPKNKREDMELISLDIFHKFIKDEITKTLEIEVPAQLNEYRNKLDQEKYQTIVHKLNNEESFLNTFKDKTQDELERLANNTFKHDKTLVNKAISLINELLNNTNQTELNTTTNNEENKQTEETQETAPTFTVGNRSFTTYTEAEKYCIESDFDPSIMIIEGSSTPQNNDTTQQINNNTETYQLYNQTFTTYNDAFNYACQNKVYTHMILSNKSSLTNEQLQHLEKQYTFNKLNMSYNDMITFFNYLRFIPETIDQQERYYKLRDMIKRYEHKQQQKKNKKELQREQMKEACLLLHFMKSKGLQVISNYDSGISSTKYIYNNETIENTIQSGGIDTQEYYELILSLFNKYFSQYKQEYSNMSIHYYKPSHSHTEPLKDIQGFIYINTTENVIAYDRELTQQEIQYYKLIPQKQLSKVG